MAREISRHRCSDRSAERGRRVPVVRKHPSHGEPVQGPHEQEGDEAHRRDLTEGPRRSPGPSGCPTARVLPPFDTDERGQRNGQQEGRGVLCGERHADGDAHQREALRAGPPHVRVDCGNRDQKREGEARVRHGNGRECDHQWRERQEGAHGRAGEQSAASRHPEVREQHQRQANHDEVRDARQEDGARELWRQDVIRTRRERRRQVRQHHRQRGDAEVGESLDAPVMIEVQAGGQVNGLVPHGAGGPLEARRLDQKRRAQCDGNQHAGEEPAAHRPSSRCAPAETLRRQTCAPRMHRNTTRTSVGRRCRGSPMSRKHDRSIV